MGAKSINNEVLAALEEMAATYKDRNAQYKDCWDITADLLVAAFPHGVPVELLRKPAFSLLFLKICKLARFLVSDLEHLDSIHDDAVYSAMIEGVIRSGQNDGNWKR